MIINIMNIVSIFSGRKPNLEILRQYLKKALDLKIIDEVNFWNNTRNSSDEEYLKTISNLKRTSSSGDGNYILITPVLSNNSFELNIRASNDIHIKISNMDTEYEVVLGGWSNTKSVIRECHSENPLLSLIRDGIADKENFNNFQVVIVDDVLEIVKNNERIMSQKIKTGFEIKNIYFKTGFNSVGELKYDTTQNKGFYLMDTCEKNWKNYYNYYNDIRYEDDIILKCDDDIVFIDIYKLPKFIDFIKNNNYDLVFANTINNGVSAFFQQDKYNLIPKELMELEYPNEGACGSLWENGEKAEKLHNYFIENYETFLNYDYNNEIIPIKSRFSINFFGYKATKWYKLMDCYDDDEYKLTVEYVKERKFKNILYSDFYVSHLSFFRQNETGIHLENVLENYHKLYESVEKSGRFASSIID